MAFPTYKKQEEIPEAFRSEYEERDGEWHPKVPDVAKLQKALDSERDRAANEEKARKAAESERDALKRTADAKEKGISEEELQKIRDAEAAARKPIEEERDRLAAENRKLKLTDRVQALALKSGVMPDRIEDAMLALDRRADLTDKDGIVVKDKDGKVTTETIDDFLKTTFKKEKPWLYAGSGAAGGGSRGSEGGKDEAPPELDKNAEAARQATIRASF